jgi:hypothetical protein
VVVTDSGSQVRPENQHPIGRAIGGNDGAIACQRRSGADERVAAIFTCVETYESFVQVLRRKSIVMSWWCETTARWQAVDTQAGSFG